jgi:hypothetical protein
MQIISSFFRCPKTQNPNPATTNDSTTFLPKPATIADPSVPSTVESFESSATTITSSIATSIQNDATTPTPTTSAAGS